MNYKFSLSGNTIPVIREYRISPSTAIVCGEVVGLSDNCVCRGDNCEKILGIAAEEHTGKYDELNPRSNGDRIRVIISPDAVYGVPLQECTALRAADDSVSCAKDGLSQSANFHSLMLVKKGENSVNTDKIGSMRLIYSVMDNDGYYTLNLDSGSKIGAGDVYALVPNVGTSVDSDEAGTGVVFARSSAKSHFKVIDVDTASKTLYVKLANSIID